MSRRLIAIPFAAALVAAPNVAVANEQGAAAGAVTGAVAGALIGGPVGAVIGAAVGGVVVGTATSPQAHGNAEAAPPPVSQDRVLVQRPRPRGSAVVVDPETTGSVVETTCVQDARGNMKCRNQAVR
jgi:phage tail tape-measure protein